MFARIANIVDCTEAEGPGRRLAIWFQGCPLRCVGCCNPEMLSFSGGNEIEVSELVRRIRDAASDLLIEGITLLGGEPFAHAAPAAEIAEQVQAMGLTVMVFSGYQLVELQSRIDRDVARLLAATDLLVDGPYDQTQPDSIRRWIGSMNQQIHTLSDRYDEDDACWRQSNTLEMRFEGGELSVNGFPAKGAVGVWKRPRRSGKGSVRSRDESR